MPNSSKDVVNSDKDQRCLAMMIHDGTIVERSDQQLCDLLALAETEGVIGLINNKLGSNLPASKFKDQLQQRAQHLAARSMLLRQEKSRVMQAIAKVRPIVLKGEAMALTCYSQYDDRPMSDMDILIKDRDMAQIRQILASEGYIDCGAVTGDIIMPQVCLIHQLPGNIACTVDVHTRVFNRPVLQNLLGYTEIEQGPGAEEYPFPGVLIPGKAHLLIHAALHLMAHHYNSRRLIWLFDIKLLADQFEPAHQQYLMEFCINNQITAAILAALEASDKMFPFADTLLIDQLRDLSNDQPTPHPAVRLLQTHSPLGLGIQDWNSLTGVPQHFAWIKQHLFPPTSYMMQRYSLVSKWLLPLFYLWRILCGSVKLVTSK